MKSKLDISKVKYHLRNIFSNDIDSTRKTDLKMSA